MATPKPVAETLTLEDMLFGLWAKSVWTAEDYSSIPADAVQALMPESRALMLEHGWTPIQAHNFFTYLRADLERKTRRHPTTVMIIELLKLETEAN